MRPTDIGVGAHAGRQLTHCFQRLYPPHTGVFATVFGAADSQPFTLTGVCYIEP